jgi:hypothetical protein
MPIGNFLVLPKRAALKGVFAPAGLGNARPLIHGGTSVKAPGGGTANVFAFVV